MNPEIEEKLRLCTSLPSPPTIAAQIITLVNDPDVDLQKFTALLRCDPALSGKILRIANSPIYPYPQKIETLHQGIMILGLNATICLALSFSLIPALRNSKGSGLDYDYFWKRALLAGTAAQVLGSTSRMKDTEELYLASLMQDLGMLVLDQVFPDLYAGNEPNQKYHAQIIQHEQEVLGVTHAEVGAWLMTQWNLPDRFRLTVSASNEPDRISLQDEEASFASCINLSGKIAEIFLSEAGPGCIQGIQKQAEARLGLDPDSFMEALEKTRCHLPETERLFDTKIPLWTNPQTILDGAREALLMRSLQTQKTVEKLQRGTMEMEAKFDELQETLQYDALTGVLNRAYLEKTLDTCFTQTVSKHEYLTLVFADVDKFKSVNDTYGHQTGDRILKAAARLLMGQIRNTDSVGRYGGEEFLLILPQTSPDEAEIVCDRILQGFRKTSHGVPKGQPVTVTISLGIATYTPTGPLRTLSDLLNAADEAVYFAKAHGRNQQVSYDKMKALQLV